MGKHLLAIMVDGQTYRDQEFNQLDDEGLAFLLNGKALPSGFLAYHYFGEKQWAEVLKLPTYDTLSRYPSYSLLVELEIALSAHGACRRCERVPADGLWQGKRYRDYDQ